jgi:hypothetical protein
MKTRCRILLSAGFVFAASPHTEAAFQNLDFESAQFSVPPSPKSLVPVSEALSGWNVYIGSGQGASIWFDNISLGGTLVSLTDGRGPAIGDFKVIDGKYSLLLFAGDTPTRPCSIAQTGTVPSDSLSLQFVSLPYLPNEGLQVAFRGTLLPFQPLKNLASGYTLYGADISTFAGTSGQLSFTVPVMYPPSVNYAVLDDIQFSPNLIPEPGVWGLCLCGGLGLWWVRRHRGGRP